MVTFRYTIRDKLGIHARPAGLLTKAAAGLDSKITISCNGKTGDAKKIMSVMMVAAKCGQEITVSLEGDTEEEDAKVMRRFFQENL